MTTKQYKCRFGYKVCYKEINSTHYIRYFLTTNYKHAVKVLNGYLRFPPRTRDTNRKLNNPKWKVIPVTVREMIDGIWREVPF